MADAFFSYSRRDQEFVHRLQETLTESQRETRLDTKDIPPTAARLQEIYAAIDKSDAFVFVISPDSTLSELCQLELAYAVKHHKRLIPILRREADQRQVPESLSNLNWLSFRAEDDYEGAFKNFLTALTTDLDQVRAHTRLLARARDWEDKGRDRSLLLRGRELQETEVWLGGNGDKEPRPTDLMEQFLLASRQGTTRRRRLLLGSAGFALLVAVILALATLYQYRLAQSWQRTARSRQLAAQANKLPEEKLDLALLLSVEACHTEETIEARSALLAVLGKQPYLKSMLHGHPKYVIGIVFSPDGKTLISRGGGSIFLWDLQSYRTIGELQGDINDVAFSPDGQILAVANLDNTITFRNAKDLKPLGSPLIGSKEESRKIAFNPNGEILLSRSFDNTIILWDLKTHHPLGPPLQGQPNTINRFAFSPDGQILAWTDTSKSITLWDLKAQKPLGPPLTGHRDAITDLAFSPNAQILASASKDKTIILWDLKTRKTLGAPLTGHQGEIAMLAFSPDGHTLASAGADKTVILWDLKTRKPLGPPLTGHESEVETVAFSPDGEILASAGDGIILWDVKTRRSLVKIPTADDTVTWSPDGQTLASGPSVPLKLWDVQALRLISSSRSKSSEAGSEVACSPDGKLIASSGPGGIKLWDLKTRQPLGPPLTGDPGDIYSLAFSPNGQILASGGDKVMLWDLKTRQPLGPPLEGQEDPALSLAFSPDGSLLVSGGSRVTLWDLNTKKPLSFASPEDKLYGYTAFSPDGTLVVSGYETLLWVPKTRQPLGPPLEADLSHAGPVAFSPTGHNFARVHTVRGRCWFDLWDLKTLKDQAGPAVNIIHSLAFSPDGRLLASSGDGIVFYDMTIPLGSPPGGDKIAVSTIVYTPDGQTLISANQDGIPLYWEGSQLAWEARACRVANRNLSQAEWQEYLKDKPYRRTCANLPEGEKDE
jgi:WD40 repeat protein